MIVRRLLAPLPSPAAAIVAMLGAVLLLAAATAPLAAAQTFTDPAGDNIRLDEYGRTVTAPDMSYASQQLLPDGRIELAMSLGPGFCNTTNGDPVETPVRALFALYTDSTYVNQPNFQIVLDTTRNAYVVREAASPQRVIAQVSEAIDASGIVTVRFDPQYVGKPQQLRWMGSQHCRGSLPYEDADFVPNVGYYALDLPFPPKPDPGTLDPPTQGQPDPLPDALPPATTAAQLPLAAGAASAVKHLTAGIPATGTLLSFSGLPGGSVAVTLGTTTPLARGSGSTKAGKLTLRLTPTRAGRRALHGSGTLKTRLKLVFTPVGGGRQTTVVRRVTLNRLR